MVKEGRREGGKEGKEGRRQEDWWVGRMEEWKEGRNMQMGK